MQEELRQEDIVVCSVASTSLAHSRVVGNKCKVSIATRFMPQTWRSVPSASQHLLLGFFLGKRNPVFLQERLCVLNVSSCRPCGSPWPPGCGATQRELPLYKKRLLPHMLCRLIPCISQVVMIEMIESCKWTLTDLAIVCGTPRPLD